jgi:hypothetical protein
VIDQTIVRGEVTGRGEEGEGKVLNISTEERAMDGTSHLATIMIGGRRRAAHRGGGSESPRDQAMRARKSSQQW